MPNFDKPPEHNEVNGPKMEKLYGHCFEMKQLVNGEPIPVGGDSVFSSEANITVQGDFENFEGLFEQSHDLAKKYNLTELQKWLEGQNASIDPKLFASLFAFTQNLKKAYPDNPAAGEAREKLYKEKNGKIKLSDIFYANIPECAEIAALAQAYLQQEGIRSSYFSGDVLWNKDEEFSGEHSFIILEDGSKKYIYDPMNPIKSGEDFFPSVYTTEADFGKEVRQNRKRFVSAKNVLSKREAFFGVNDGMNVNAEKDII